MNSFDKKGKRRPEINGGTKLAGAFQVNLVENHQFSKRHAQTIASVSFNKKLTSLVIRGLADRDVQDFTLLAENNQKYVQTVTDILADNDLVSVNKLKSYVEGPVDKVAKLLEAIAKLDAEELEDFKTGYEILTGESE